MSHSGLLETLWGPQRLEVQRAAPCAQKSAVAAAANPVGSHADGVVPRRHLIKVSALPWPQSLRTHFAVVHDDVRNDVGAVSGICGNPDVRL
jgi:hypothetical protein